MYTASLLLKESTSTSLSALVEKALLKKPPFPIFELQLNAFQVCLLQKTNPDKLPKPFQPDEGFESDIDSLSIVSSDESFTSNNVAENSSKTPETDSANGSASSDSDTDTPSSQEQNYSKDDVFVKPKIETKEIENKESYNLVNCICYTDVKCTEILVFVIGDKALVFKFDNVLLLQQFHENFAAFKAVNSQVIYNKNSVANRKFNLLQKTDNNGITHIQVKREPIKPAYVEDGPSSIISLNTPEDNLNKLIKSSVQHIKSLNEYNKTNTINRRFKQINSDTLRRKEKSASADDLLDLDQEDLIIKVNPVNSLRRVWNSSENIIDEIPQRPERKKKSKGKAPLPPDVEIKQDILSGQYVKVHVPNEKNETSRAIIRGQVREPHPKKLQNFGILSTKPSINTLVKNKAAQILKYAPKKFETSTLTRHKTPPQETWTNSIPRFFKQPRSRSETRVAQPMAYRYIDTTMNYPVTYLPVATANGRVLKSHEVPYSFGASNFKSNASGASSNIGNRLFGLSPKLRDFNPQPKDSVDGKWGSNEYQRHHVDGNLKSVIKKDENKRKNEKKVTFSAYTTVQVV